jgi:hypothetical protein
VRRPDRLGRAVRRNAIDLGATDVGHVGIWDCTEGWERRRSA